MDAQEFFARDWPKLAPQLRAALARAGAPTADREDLVQETAVRLIAAWDSIDWGRGPEALARTIALNAWRDQWRRRGAREVIGDVPEMPAALETERVAMARVEVSEVSRALRLLRPATARVLQEAAEEAEGVPSPSSAALRMARTRARRALAASLKIASAVAAAVAVSLRWFARPARSTVAIGAVAGVAWMLALGGAPATKAPTWAPPGAAASAALDLRTTTSHPGVNAFVTHARTATAKHVRAHQASDPPYIVNAGPASVSILVSVDVFGHGAEVRQPTPDHPAPACTYGDTPSNPVVGQCPVR
jgi:DNA-directed RNA polymerase specialized sigma24 family protein